MERQARQNPRLRELYKRLDDRAGPTLIGLTGGIATGKTLVASFFKKRRIPVVDADRIAREVMQPGKKAYREIVQVFGPALLKQDRTIDRQALGKLVFADEGRRRLLESITHPEILNGIRGEMARLRKKRRDFIVVDAALLFESGLDRETDKTILVTCHPSVQLKRLVQRDKLSETEAWARVLAQLLSSAKEKRANYVIDNSGKRGDTERQFLKIWRAVGRAPARKSRDASLDP